MSEELKKKTVLLCILDGFGFGDENRDDNAIARAEMKNFQRFLQDYSYSSLETSGLAVGLPEGQIGNSEVGHMTIGAGRIIYQDLVKINKEIESDQLKKHKYLLELVSDLKKTKKKVHLCGLFSDGGVHAHQNHIGYLAKFLALEGIEVKIHAFLDGRDVAQKSAKKYYQEFVESISDIDNIEISTVSGRHYAMDRDNNWDRVKMAYDAIVKGESSQENIYNIGEFEKLIDESYEEGDFDEFVKPCVFEGYQGGKEGDALIFMNFRADRARQISNALINPDFSEFETNNLSFSHQLSMTSYSDELDKFYKVLFESEKIDNGLAEILSNNSKKQLRIAETEKYAHVTFFFSCGREKEFEGEKRILIKSPDVKTYDLKPEMSASEVGNNLVEKIESNEFDFIVVNYANPDMVGHSGNLEASIQACKVIDQQLFNLEKAILAQGGSMFVTADHGNIECMKDEYGEPHTSHTMNLVPFIHVCDGEKRALQDGNLSDIAPTILDLMGFEKPLEMTGDSLFRK